MAAYQPNSINLTKAVIEFTSDDLLVNHDITSSLIEMTIDEGLWQTTLNGRLMFIDAADIFNKIDFDGTELVKVDFSSPGGRDISFEMQVYKDVVTQSPDGGGGKIVQLFFVSKEHFIDPGVDINVVFSGTISEFVKKLYIPLKSTKPLIVHPTTGSLDTHVPGMTSFEAIEFVGNRAFDGKYTSSLFTFYETFDAYHFANVERLIADNRKTTLKYTYSPTGNIQAKDKSQQFIIESLDTKSNKDVMKKLVGGMYNSAVTTVDLINQNVTTRTFKLDSDESFQRFVHLDDEAMSLDSVKQIEDSLSVSGPNFWLTRTYVDATRSTNFEVLIPRRLYLMTALEQVETSIVVPGNSDLTTGMVIDIDMLEQNASTKTKEQEEKISGNYLVTKIQHMITRDSYKCAVMLAKESYRANVRRPTKNFVSYPITRKSK
jgi:hypothetical protein